VNGGEMSAKSKTGMEIISSRSNAKIRYARALKQRKQRLVSRSFLVEGIHQVGAAIEAGAQVETIFYAPDLLKSQYALDLIEASRSNRVPCYEITPEVFTSLASKENPQGILAVVHQPEGRLQELNAHNFAWGVACVSPQDPGNVGAILRTIDAVGANGLILLDGGVDAFHPTAVRASMGAIFRHPVVNASFKDFNAWVDRYNCQVVGTSAHGSVDYREIKNFSKPLVLLLGDERHGLTSQQVEICQSVVRLPMHGQVTSLNLAVAAGIMLYELLAKMEGD
jgi:TrmH family RNA methyltransferase